MMPQVVVLGVIVSQLASSTLGQYVLPTNWPSTDQTHALNGEFLKDPLVTNAVALVNSLVPAALLQIPPSTFVSGATVKYNANPGANGYLGVRPVDTAGFKADFFNCPDVNQWGLTYDDGPTVNLVNGVHTDDTGAIREALGKTNLKATFFIAGSNGIRFPEEIALTHQAGHQLAIHTWTHHPLTSLTNEQVVAELKYTEALIYKTVGVLPVFFRPPYGDIDDRVRAIASALGFRNALWTTTPHRDSVDAGGATTDAQKTIIHNNVKSWYFSQPGFVSLEHDISTFTASIAVAVIQDIQAAGAAFPLKPMPMGTCLNAAWYKNVKNPGVPTPSGTGTTTAGGNPTATLTETDIPSSSRSDSKSDSSKNAMGILVLAVMVLAQ